MKIHISIVVPVYNEDAAIRGVVDDLLAHFPSTDVAATEILILDDASTDGTGAILSTLNDPRIRLIPNAQRGGCGRMRIIGSRAAQGDLVVWIDGDGSYLAADGSRLCSTMNDVDQVIGLRDCDHGNLRWLRFSVKRTICVIASLLWWRHIPDINCGLRVFRRERLLELIDELPDGFSCGTTATLAALNRGHRLDFQAISYRQRPPNSVSKFRPFRDTLLLLRVVLRQLMRRSHHHPAAT